MTSITKKAIISLCVYLTLLKSVHCISCYQCSGTDSNNPFECTENLDSDSDMPLTDCSNIHDAQFCIKYVGRYEGHAIDCYQCNSSTTMECGDGLINMEGGLIRATPCVHVYNAQYCIKQIGGISTKRYCSSLDLGNYCNYVSQPGDKLEYRTCIHTCGSDGCNAAASLTWSVGTVGLLVGVILRIFTQ